MYFNVKFLIKYVENYTNMICSRKSDGHIIPIEVKSADNTKAKSLKVYMETYHPSYAIKLSMKNFGFEDGKRQFRSMQCFVFECSEIHGIQILHILPEFLVLFGGNKACQIHIFNKNIFQRYISFFGKFLHHRL